MTAKPPLQEVGGAVAFLVGDCMVMFSVLALTVMQGTSIAQNMTTNEMTNAFKYKYLQDDKVTTHPQLGPWTLRPTPYTLSSLQEQQL